MTEFPVARALRAEERELFAALTSHLAQVLARARDYAQARAVALTLQQAILGPTKLPHGFAARYVPAVEPLEVGGDWYDVVPMPGHRIGVVVGDCVGRGLPAAWRTSTPSPAGSPRPSAPRYSAPSSTRRPRP